MTSKGCCSFQARVRFLPIENLDRDHLMCDGDYDVECCGIKIYAFLEKWVAHSVREYPGRTRLRQLLVSYPGNLAACLRVDRPKKEAARLVREEKRNKEAKEVLNRKRDARQICACDGSEIDGQTLGCGCPSWPCGTTCR